MDTARALLNGATELHVHSSPDVFPRLMDHVEVAKHLKEYGYKAVVLKCHHHGTADRVPLVRQLVSGIDVYGSISLNYPVGGLNPFAVDTALKYGAKIVWLPTVDAENHVHFFGAGQFKGLLAQSKKMPRFYSEAKGISVFNEKGKLRDEVYDIIDLVNDYNVGLALGHLSIPEIEAVAKAVKERGLKRAFINHPNLWFMGKMPIEKQLEIAKLGVKIEYCCGELTPRGAMLTPTQYADNIRKLGAENVVLDNDTGTLNSPYAGEAMRIYVQLLLEEKISEEDIRTMLVKNTAEMIGLS